MAQLIKATLICKTEVPRNVKELQLITILLAFLEILEKVMEV